MKTREIKELTNQEIAERLQNEQAHLIRIKMNHAISPLDNPMQIKTVRRTIARIHTEISKRAN